MIQKTVLFLSLFISTLYAQSINIAVAANVSYASDELIKKFNKEYPNTRVRVTLGSSGKLTAHIKHGAPYHLFMSANMSYPQALYDAKIATTKPVIYADGTLAFLTTKRVDLHLGMELLKTSQIKRIAIPNPKTAPYGKVSLQAFISSGVYEEIKSKLVFAESASSVVTYAIRATDIGIVPASTLYSAKMKKYKQNVNWIELDSSLYTPIHQSIVILKKGEKREDVMNFYKFILSPKGRKIFRKYGYITP